jgi:cell division protein FtsZ
MRERKKNRGVKKVIDDIKVGIFNRVKNSLKNDSRYPEPSIVCVGIGGGGCNIVSELNRRRSEVRLFCLNTDAVSNAKRSEVIPMNFGAEYILDNRDSGGFVEVAKKAFREDAPMIGFRLLKKADLVLLVVTLGGGTGSGGAVEMVKLLKNENTPFRVYVVRPFEFEDNRKEVADRTLAQLRRETDQIDVYDNNEFGSIAEVNRRIKDDINGFIERKVDFYEKMYTKCFDQILNETVGEVLSEEVLSINLEVAPLEAEVLRHP